MSLAIEIESVGFRVLRSLQPENARGMTSSGESWMVLRAFLSIHLSGLLWLVLMLPASMADAQTPRPRPVEKVPVAPVIQDDAAARSEPKFERRVPTFVQPVRRSSGNAESRLRLIAKLTADGPPVRSGLVWHIFSDQRDEQGKLILVDTAIGGVAQFVLKEGSYMVHASYGRAGATSRVVIGPKARTQTVVINAGGLKLFGIVAEDTPIGPDQLAFDIYRQGSDQDEARLLVVKDAKPDEFLRLNAGIYHVVSRYGEVNAVMRADIEVKPGKLTEAKVYHKAARITLKLVNEPGGEALADTSWAVLTISGDPVVDRVGAFASFILAEGTYSAVAQHGGDNFSREITVEAGSNKEIEVLAAK
jgi:hypothetical protein